MFDCFKLIQAIVHLFSVKTKLCVTFICFFIFVVGIIQIIDCFKLNQAICFVFKIKQKRTVMCYIHLFCILNYSDHDARLFWVFVNGVCYVSVVFLEANRPCSFILSLKLNKGQLICLFFFSIFCILNYSDHDAHLFWLLWTSLFCLLYFKTYSTVFL